MFHNNKNNNNKKKEGRRFLNDDEMKKPFSNNKKRKRDEQQQQQHSEERCSYFMPHKNRYCSQKRKPGSSSMYCGNHCQFDDDDEKKKKKRGRIPCPVDPSHTIYEDQLYKHIKICPKVLEEKRVKSLEYYTENINRGPQPLLPEAVHKMDLTDDEAKEFAVAILQVFCRVFDVKLESGQKYPTYEQIYNAIPEQDLSQTEYDAGLNKVLSDGKVRAGGEKHIRQQGSIVGHLREWGLLPSISTSSAVHSPCVESSSSNNDTFSTFGIKINRNLLYDSNICNVIEMGAGRGMLGLVVAGVMNCARKCEDSNCSVTSFHMIDYGGSTGKAETRVRQTREEIKDSKYLRIHDLETNRMRCDLSHVNFPVAFKDRCSKNGYKNSGHLVVGKHVCGGATDISLRSIRVSKEKKLNISGCCFAVCCHGLCTWRDYVGKYTLRDLFIKSSMVSEFSEAHFKLLSRWSTGTVTDGPEQSISKYSEYNPNIEFVGSYTAPVEQEDIFREEINVKNIRHLVRSLDLSDTCGIKGLGRACQRLIDYGRLRYMVEELGMERSRLVYYCGEDTTPQNALLIGR